MLNKEICKRCNNLERAKCEWEWNESPWTWGPRDEACWAEGMVRCSAVQSVWLDGVEIGNVWIRYLPPRSCPYQVEHVVSQDAE